MHRLALAPALLSMLLAACSSSTASPALRPTTTDARVRSFSGQPPPEIAADVRWLNAQPTSLAALSGRVVFLQFAFPT